MVVRRSAVRMWLLALGAIPLLVIAVDVLTNRKITNWLREVIFRPEDTQIYEPRDVIFAWTMLLFASFFIVWGLKELFVATKVVECRDDGLALKLRGPFHSADIVPWANVVDVSAGKIRDEGDTLPLLNVEVLGRQDLPENPWGARWVSQRVLGILAQDWSDDSSDVATQITEYAVDAARREARDRTSRIWQEP